MFIYTTDKPRCMYPKLPQHSQHIDLLPCVSKSHCPCMHTATSSIQSPNTHRGLTTKKCRHTQ